MTRYAELSRKAGSLWNAASVCDDANMKIMYIEKTKKLFSIRRSLSIDQSEQSAIDRRNHVLSAVGLQLVEYRKEYTKHYKGFLLNRTWLSVRDPSTGLPITWGELIERMNG